MNNCIKNGIKKEGESCSLNNNCIYPECMENNITAEEFLKPYHDDLVLGRIILHKAMIEFAKLHCEAQLKAILEKAKTKIEWEGNTGSEYYGIVVDKDSIINAYDLNKIK